MLECVVNSFCAVFPLRCGVYVVAVYQALFWVAYWVPVLQAAQCFPREIVAALFVAAPSFGMFATCGSLVLLYGMLHEAPPWAVALSLWVHSLTAQFALVAGLLLTLSLDAQHAGCPQYAALAALHLLQLACQYYGLVCVNSYYIQLEMTDQC